jgi:hypothetical protein
MVGYQVWTPDYRRLPYCGCWVIISSIRKYVPLLSVKAHTTIINNASRTTLTQTFANPNKDSTLEELVYQFPLYDGVSVVSFTCTVGDRIIHGVVKERQEAKQTYNDAVAQGQTAGLMEQSLDAADVFTTKIGKVPAGKQVRVELTYLGELKHDAEVDGLRFTIPTSISPRYGQHEVLTGSANNVRTGDAGFEVTVDAEMPNGAAIKSVQSPSHPISVQIGFSSKSNVDSDEPSLQRASANLSLGSTGLDKDFILQVTATKLGEPSAVLENHPTIPNQRALMATLVPKFTIPADKPEIVFVCDRSGSMAGSKIDNLVSALNVFLRSLPVGVKFNICSFGSRHEFLWPKSQTYSQETLEAASKHVKTFTGNFGGTQMYKPLEDTFKQRYKDMNLEVFLLTDGEIWDQDKLFGLINDKVQDSKGAIRLFTLGIGRGASHALIEGVARAGNGFAQTVSDDEKMDKKVVRMLKGALSPHINDYTLEIKYKGGAAAESTSDDEFELIEKAQDALVISTPPKQGLTKKVISLFDTSVKDDTDTTKAAKPDHKQKYDHLPPIETPRYLQAPASIPPLFPFNRTTVYVLLSGDDDTISKRIPASVLLKATSAHGPLELEIPVTVLPEPGETIHQLAARKAVKELEEGRGWIAQAKSKKGKLLKEEFEGHFSDMVEREAVRLGVKFQVGGKWCSFVAVQDDKQKDADKAAAGDRDGEIEVQTASAPNIELARGGGGRARFFGMPSAPAPMAAAAFGVAQSYGSDQRSSSAPRASSFARMTRRSAGPLFSTGGSPAVQVDENDTGFDYGGTLPSEAVAAPGGSLFGPPPAPSSAYAPPPPAPAKKLKARARESKGSDTRAFDLSSSAEASSEPELARPQDPLQVIASGQAFSGQWSLSSELEKVTGITAAEAKKAIEAAGLKRDSGDDLVATAIAIAFLKNRLAQQKEAWEMIVDKAVMWMEEQVGEGEVDKWVDAVGALLADKMDLS